MRRRAALAGFAVVSLLPGCATAPPSLDALLASPVFAGPDFAVVLLSLRGWHVIGEQEISVFAAQVQGRRGFFDPAQAVELAMTLGRSVAGALPPLRAAFEGLRGAANRMSLVQANSAKSIDDDGFHVVLSAPQAVFLRSGLRIADVQRAFGPPAAVSTVLLQNAFERRPEVLTVYSYGNGAISFATSDAGEAGAVQRLIIRIDRVLPQVVK